MGVKLRDIILRSEIDLKQLKGSIIAIDGPNLLMNLLSFTIPANASTPNFYNQSNLIIDRTQRVISHLYGLLYRINFLYSKDILPIICFDGKVSPLKRKQTKDFLNDFRFAKRQYEKAIENQNKQMAKKIAFSKEFLWPNVIYEAKQTLSAFGVPYINSPVSAESQCAYLVQEKFADYSNSQDYDSLLFGCPRMIQNLSKSLRRKVRGRWKYIKIIPSVINLEDNLNSLKISRFQLIDISILVGTDYNEGVKGIGPKTGLKYIKKYGNLERLMKKERVNFEFDHLTPEMIKEIRKIFLFPEVISKFDDLLWNFPNQNRILYLFCEDHHLNRGRVSKFAENLEQNFESCLSYFQAMKDQPKMVQKTLLSY
ncbi:MAG: putative Flap endonuclease 1 [Promethearchaeota archaeon]|nr:MAG: putative Flap endonuclease 1 [Candidatus Lokiarchaeota archaeon]